MQRLTVLFALFALTLTAPFVSGCGGDSSPPDMVREDFDAGTDICTSVRTTCDDLSKLLHVYCETADRSACYLRRNNVRYDCEACGEVGGCFEATERLVVEQCP